MQDPLLVEDGIFFGAMLPRADAMPYEAKKKGRHRLCPSPKPTDTSRTSQLKSSPVGCRPPFNRCPEPPNER